MNIGIVTTWFASGGGYVSKNYERALSKKHRIFIYARGGAIAKGDAEWDLSNVTWAPPHPCITGIYDTHFMSWIRKYSIEAILFNEQRYWRPLVLARKLGLLVGAYVDYYTQDTAPLFELYDFLICNTKRHYNVFKHHPQCRYIPWGTQIANFYLSKKQAGEPITFLVSAGWNGKYARGVSWLDRRGAGVAMRVFRRVTENCRLIVLSQVPLENCPPEWKSAVLDDKRIEFRVGTFSPVPYADGDVYVYPSRLDGLGLTVPEALSCGLPVITTDSPPMNEFVQHDYNGLLVKVKEYRGRPDGYYWAESICDEDQLLEAVMFYINNPSKIMAHGINARAYATENLSWEKNSADLADWISMQKRLSNRPGVALKKLEREALRYDRWYNPTPWVRMLSGAKGLLNMFLTLGQFYIIRKNL